MALRESMATDENVPRAFADRKRKNVLGEASGFENEDVRLATMGRYRARSLGGVRGLAAHTWLQTPGYRPALQTPSGGAQVIDFFSNIQLRTTSFSKK